MISFLRPSPRAGGFSLLELLIVLTLVALLLGFAIPGYQHYMQRSRRSDALDALYRLQQAQVRYRGFHTGYAGALADLKTPFASGNSTQGYYRLETGTPKGEEAYSFFVRAQAVANGAQSGDADCQTLTLNQRQQTVTLEPPACWSGR
ncbi:type IV pilin protein [Chromobacterium paludis]|uniref:Prepilin-type N-terminal cleavage/methylation domain-containing protein n=1 Tax=Chromobacterium paludis TaxID=2605945 RepID=A0A5C1DNR6_9NEIS|nr:type IV pilin protein [Chromobacterium paludis]QEL57659.1 prepilin-type N-terminal cleavage/methylation domain-containing protein [Chromobacterium paludis]